jgi:hypothetical protein
MVYDLPAIFYNQIVDSEGDEPISDLRFNCNRQQITLTPFMTERGY